MKDRRKKSGVRSQESGVGSQKTGGSAFRNRSCSRPLFSILLARQHVCSERRALSAARRSQPRFGSFHQNVEASRPRSSRV